MLLLLFTAVVLATSLNQLVQQLQRLRINRPLAVFLSIGVLLTLLIGFFLVIVPPFVDQFQELVALVPTGIAQIQVWLTWLEERILGWYSDLPDINIVIEQAIQQIQTRANQLLGISFEFFFYTY